MVHINAFYIIAQYDMILVHIIAFYLNINNVLHFDDIIFINLILTDLSRDKVI